jgi:putative isomerase
LFLVQGLDQSPLWDCPLAKPDGSGGNCSVYTYRNPKSSPHVLQLADMQSTSLFVLDAESIATLAVVINRTTEGGGLLTRLRSRAAQMKAQLSKAWDPQTQSFRDIYPQTGTFSDKLTPTSFYPLYAGAATDEQAVAMVHHHLLNASEFCISADYARDPSSRCYWGLPSIAASAASFMQPLHYVYWRGLSWGPMTLLTWWALDAHSNVPQVKAARTLLAKQKTDMMMSIWHLHHHICENYSPYAPNSTVSPGTNNGGQRNDECTGWQFYHWGALNGLTTLLEAGA